VLGSVEMISRYYRRRGFTLIELMVTALILTIVLGAVYASLRVGLAAWRATEIESDQNQLARVVLSHISRELRSAFVTPSGSASAFEFLGLPGEGEGTDGGYADRLAFVYAAPSGPAADAGAQLRRVAYFLGESEERSAGRALSLYRYDESALEPVLDLRGFMEGDIDQLDNDRAMTDPEELLDSVKELQFSYYNGVEWTEEWLSDVEPPRAVSVSLILQGGADGGDATFTTTVEIPTVHDVGGSNRLKDRYDVATLAEDVEQDAVTLRLTEAPERAEPGTMTIKSGGRTIAQVEYTEIAAGVATLRSGLPRSAKKGDQAWILRSGSQTTVSGRFIAGGSRQVVAGSDGTPVSVSPSATDTPTVIGPDGREIQLPPPPPDQYY